MLYVAGETIPADSSVVISAKDGKAYVAGEVSGTLVGNAAEQLREGFRVIARRGEVREDDA